MTHQNSPLFLKSALRLYNRASFKASHKVIEEYSTSFSLSTWLLSPRIRNDIRNLYAVVRIADEIVDGTAHAAGCSTAKIEEILDAYEIAVLAAPQQCFNTDLVLQAYGETARRCDFEQEHVIAFFASMRKDLKANTHDPDSFTTYVYGSAEVIGLLCLSVFNQGRTISKKRLEIMQNGARSLGAAFQKINFLRDLAEDQQNLGRFYFPETSQGTLTKEQKEDLIADIRQDLAIAHDAFPEIPVQARIGVISAYLLFQKLTDRIEATPTSDLLQERVRVPLHIKLSILASATMRGLSMSIYRKNSR
ncbi:phytoene synthase [Corynebacterium glutamicum ZL-6]|uniref:phytoene/squalene synthase family protein n=1 Tax=Corynebacterium TaxID=1716 RepID=UPI000807312F|nr:MULTISPECIES: phytoene/squalene synthase family protein [Corynebacterium]ANR61697.1 phytoene synthase [[Brevibacterium] flavum ZL-1]ANR64697.1 phytoene synthase [Corynebacterium glutamicum ZL-6]PST76773.1 phytoene synthase [Corynebacterium glutamicum ZL-2]